MQERDLQIKNIKIEKIKPYENNAKIHTEEQINQIMESIKDFGFNDPLGIDEHGVIIEGHGRYEAAKRLGMQTVPVIIIKGLTEQQKIAYALVHNKLTMDTDFDLEILSEELKKIDTDDFDFSVFDFDVDYNINIDIDESNSEIPANNFSDNTEQLEYFSNDEIKKDIVSAFPHYDSLDEYIAEIIDIPKAKFQFNRLCNGFNDGYNISLLFNPHRLDTSTARSKSIFDSINNNETYKRHFARYLIDVQKKCPTKFEYYKYIGVGCGNVQYVNEFQPYLARDIYKTYVNSGDVVLDPCAGWGGRTIGLASCLFENITYISAEPSTKTYSGLLKLKEFLKLGDNYQYFNIPFEKMKLAENSVDFVFTSPPYYDTEHYSDEKTQSYIAYKSYEEWKNKFLYVMLDKILFALKPNKKALLNVGKVRYPIDKDIEKYLIAHNAKYKYVSDFKIGGSGIGRRVNGNTNEGEPFIEFIAK